MARLDQAIGQAHAQRFFARYAAAGQNQVECMAVADEAGQADGAEVDQRNAEAAAEDAEYRIARRHAQIAPQGEFQAAGNGIALHGGHHRFRKKHPRWTHGPVAALCELVALAASDGFQVGACAKGTARAGHDCDAESVVGVETTEGRGQSLSGGAIDGVAGLGPVDGDDQDLVIHLSLNGIQYYFPFTADAGRKTYSILSTARLAMLLTSPAYFAFLVVVFFAFWLARRNRMGALAVILFANYFFCARWDLIYLALIPAASACDFFIGRALGRLRRPAARRALVSMSLLVNVGLIVSVKYSPNLPWVLPLGLSFYAFQSLTYTLDIYRRDAEPAPSLLAYLASASFFPTTVAGPITRLSDLIPQWAKWRALSAEDGGRALFLIALGLVKKLLIADYLAENLINRVFDLPKLYSGGEVLAGVYAYAFQLYYDFSGYTDIALGSALLVGIKLPANFNRPYAAQNIADFWRRWHISFSNWLRDYLYFSLPGLRSRWKVFAYLNLVVTMAIGGLWHGASWTFLIWGIWHGAGLAAHRWWQAFRGNARRDTSWAWQVGRALLTFHFVLISWVFFRASSVATAREIFSQVFSGTFSFANVTPGFAIVLAIAAGAHFVPKQWYEGGLRYFVAAPYYAQAVALAAVLLAIQYVAASGSAPFIYSRF